MDDSLKPPTKTPADRAHAHVREGLRLVAGGTGARLFEYLVEPPIEKRLNAWREEVGNRIQQLEDDKQVDVEALMDNEAFISTLLHASHAAIRTHQKEKRDALRNAVLNAALPNAPNENRQQLFLN